METVKILIVENELVTALRMQTSLEKCGYKTTITSTGEEALDLLKTDSYHVALMDIHLDGKIDGITTARSLKRLYSIPVIFVTELQDEEIFNTAKEVIPQNYITKPFSDKNLLRAVELAIKQPISLIAKSPFNHIESRVTDGVFILTDIIAGIEKTYKKILFDDLLYMEAKGNYTNIYTASKDNGKMDVSKISVSSNHVFEQLNYAGIVKVHKTYYVNIHKIEKIQGSQVFIFNHELPVGNEYKNDLEKRLMYIKHKSTQK
jgi:two-component system, response regulator PdtaR